MVGIMQAVVVPMDRLAASGVSPRGIIKNTVMDQPRTILNAIGVGRRWLEPLGMLVVRTASIRGKVGVPAKSHGLRQRGVARTTRSRLARGTTAEEAPRNEKKRSGSRTAGLPPPAVEP